MLAPLAIAAVLVAGHSAQGRPIVAHQLGDPAGAERVLVVGCIHGTECAGHARRARAAERCRCRRASTSGSSRTSTPTGSPHGTRLNGRGVDLNRNFPAGWRPGGRPGDLQYPGPRPFSEPETRAAARLIDQVRPDVTIWYHQHMDLVWAWGPSRAAGAAYARAAGMRFAADAVAGRHGAALAEHRARRALVRGRAARRDADRRRGAAPGTRRPGGRDVRAPSPGLPGRSRSLRAVPVLLVAVAYAIGCISPGYLLVRRATGLDLRVDAHRQHRRAQRRAGGRPPGGRRRVPAGRRQGRRRRRARRAWPARATRSRPPACWPSSPATCSPCSFGCAAAAGSRRRWAGCWSPRRSPRSPASPPARSSPWRRGSWSPPASPAQ